MKVACHRRTEKEWIMRGLRVVVVVLTLVVVVLVGVGYYQGWFHITVDKDRFQEDRQGVLDRMRELEPGLKDKSVAPTEKRTGQDVP